MTAIFYLSHDNPHRHRGLHRMWQDGRFIGYVRIELFDGDVDEAMAAAKPRRGESLMNTYEIAPAGKRRPR